MPSRSSKFRETPLTELSHRYHVGVFNVTSLSQGSVLGAVSGSGKGKQKPHSKDRVGVRSLSSWVQCLGQKVVMDFFDQVAQ